MNPVLAGILDASRRRPIAAPPADAASRPRRRFGAAVRGRHQLSRIAEWKRRSPSSGRLDGSLDCASHLRGYAADGAAALSIVTEPTEFAGSLDDLHTARRATDLPILRKDFLLRPEQVAESAAHGADAVLLIVRCLSAAQLGELVAACRDHDLDALVECHDREEVERALAFPDVLVGVNNRDLETLRVDLRLAAELLPAVPHGRIAVAESGYGATLPHDSLQSVADALLVGTACMRRPSLSVQVQGGRP